MSKEIGNRGVTTKEEEKDGQNLTRKQFFKFILDQVAKHGPGVMVGFSFGGLTRGYLEGMLSSESEEDLALSTTSDNVPGVTIKLDLFIENESLRESAGHDQGVYNTIFVLDRALEQYLGNEKDPAKLERYNNSLQNFLNEINSIFSGNNDIEKDSGINT